MPEQHPQQEPEEQEEEARSESRFNSVTVVAFVSLNVVALVVAVGAIRCYLAKSRKRKQEVQATVVAEKAAESEVTMVATSMEEGVSDEKKRREEDDNTSTLAPSSDKQSEPSLNGDVEAASE